MRARAARARGAVHERGAAAARRRRARALRVASRGHAARGGAPPLVSRLDRRDVVARARRRRGARADGARRTRSRRPPSGSFAARSTAREDPLIPGAWVVDRVDERRRCRGAHLAAEPRLAARRPRRRLAARRADARPVRRPGRQGDDARGRGRRGRGRRGAGPSSSRRTRDASARRASASSTRTAASCRPELDGFDRALVDAPCSGLGVLASRPDLRWRAEPLPELQLELLRAAIERVRPGGTVVYSTCTINAEENEAIVDAVVEEGHVTSTRPSATSGPRSGTARVPSSCRRCRTSTARAASSSPGWS